MPPRAVPKLTPTRCCGFSLDQATPAVLKAHLTAEVAKWGPILKAAGAKGE